MAVMTTKLTSSIGQNLQAKRDTLNAWLAEAPSAEIETCTCDGQSVQPHLEVIETTLHEIETGELGVCEICHAKIEAELLEMDYTASVCLEHYNDAERRRLEAELELSQAVQRALRPLENTGISGVDMAVYSRPAEIVSGDTYDFFKFGDGHPGIAIADAVGHGVSAGLLMSSVQTALRLLAPESDSPITVLERINRLFLHNHSFTTFATIFLASFDPTSGLLTYSNAGHNPPFLYCPRDGSITLLPPTGPAVGLIEMFHLHAETIQVGEGDILLLYTDGVTEAHNPQREDFSATRLAALVREYAEGTSTHLVQTILHELEIFRGGAPVEDDLTLVAIKFSQPAHQVVESS